MIARSLPLIFLTIYSFAFAKDSSADKSAALLNLNPPLKLELNIYYADGGTMGGTITDSNQNTLKFSYDGRHTFWTMLPWYKYHVYLGAHHPTHDTAEKLPVCSDKEIAIATLVADWINREYPEDWRDTEKWVWLAPFARFINDMENRKCKLSL